MLFLDQLTTGALPPDERVAPNVIGSMEHPDTLPWVTEMDMLGVWVPLTLNVNTFEEAVVVLKQPPVVVINA